MRLLVGQPPVHPAAAFDLRVHALRRHVADRRGHHVHSFGEVRRPQRKRQREGVDAKRRFSLPRHSRPSRVDRELPRRNEEHHRQFPFRLQQFCVAFDQILADSAGFRARFLRLDPRVPARLVEPLHVVLQPKQLLFEGPRQIRHRCPQHHGRVVDGDVRLRGRFRLSLQVHQWFLHSLLLFSRRPSYSFPLLPASKIPPPLDDH